MALVSKILVVRLSSIGDIILTTPLLRSLKTAWPDAHVTYVIKKEYEELLNHSPYVDELITFDKKEGFPRLKQIRERLKSVKFDICLDIHKNWRSRYLRSGIRAASVTSYRKHIIKRTLLIWFKINLYKQVRPVYERYFDSLKSLGVQYDGRGTEIYVPAERTAKVRILLDQAGYTHGKPLVIICPSATYFNKKWMPSGFIETAKRLIHERSAFIVVHGGPGDKMLCGSIASETGNQAVSLAGQLSLSESAALLKMSNLVIANDSGLLHLAQSQKVPVVGIYGATTRELGYFPLPENSTVMEARVSCRPCTHNGLNHCPKKHFRCMMEISADSVIEAALKYIPLKN